MSDLKDLRERLESLGSDALTIANRLREMGIVGQRCHEKNCPLVHYLEGQYPGHSFEVDNNIVQIDGEGRCDLPLAHEQFVDHFDSGHFPDLIDATKADPVSLLLEEME